MIALITAMAVSGIACSDGKKDSANSKDGTNSTDSTNSADSTSPSDSADGSEKETGTDDGTADDLKAADVSYDVEKCVELGDYSALKVSLANVYEVTKEQIEDYAQSMAEYYAPAYKDTDKKTVENGDIVNIDYVGKKDGVAFDHGSDTDYNLEIGSNSFIDGFEEGLVGKKVGETVDLNLTFPENYQSAELAGAKVVFTVTINKIVERDEDAKVKLTDEFVKSNFNYETVADYKEKVKEYLELTNESAKSEDTKRAVKEKLLEVCKVTVPEDLIEAKVSEYAQQFASQNCSDGQTLDAYLKEKYNGMTEKEFREQAKTGLMETLKSDLILEAVAKKEGLTLDEDAFQQYLTEQMTANGFEKSDDYFATKGVDSAAGKENERKTFLNNQALDYIVKNADIKYGTASAEDTAAEAE